MFMSCLMKNGVSGEGVSEIGETENIKLVIIDI